MLAILPRGWKRVFDPNTGLHYYYHTDSKISTWALPSETSTQQSQKRSAPDTEDYYSQQAAEWEAYVGFFVDEAA